MRIIKLNLVTAGVAKSFVDVVTIMAGIKGYTLPLNEIAGSKCFLVLIVKNEKSWGFHIRC